MRKTGGIPRLAACLAVALASVAFAAAADPVADPDPTRSTDTVADSAPAEAAAPAEASTPAEDPTHAAAAAPAPAADFPTLDGWTPASEGELYDPDTLWQLINGAADQYLAYGFELLRYREFTDGEQEVAVEIYDMGAPLNAFGIYRTERGVGEVLDVGAEAVVTPPYQALMLKGASFVRVSSFAGALDLDSAGGLLAGVAAGLAGESALPAELAWLPERKRVAGSEAFTPSSHLGLSELRNCLHADFDDGAGGKYQVFLVLPEPGAAIDALWTSLTENWRLKKRRGRRILIREIPYRGFVGLIRGEHGLLGCVAETESVLGKRLGRLAP